jgi:hypothetical protein
MGEAAVAGDAEDAARMMRRLAVSGRRLVWREARWVVLAREGDRRTRALGEMARARVEAMIATGELRRAEGGGYVLAPEARAAMAAAPAEAGPGVFVAAGLARPRLGGAGFAGLAARAQAGEGPMSRRAAMAGVRLASDAEQAARTTRTTMDWSATPATRGRRAAGEGGPDEGARAASARLARVSRFAGAEAMRLAWAACVEALALATLERRFSLPKRTGAARLNAALEQVAAGYDRG